VMCCSSASAASSCSSNFARTWLIQLKSAALLTDLQGSPFFTQFAHFCDSKER
jgi:hypothetical protein